MSLFNLIEQHNRVGLAAYRLGQLTALIVSDISGRRSDKTGDGVFLHIFGHIDTNHVVFVIKQTIGKSLCKLRLADTGGTQEQEATDRLVGVGYACTGAEDSLCDFLNRFVLTDNALMDNIVEVEQLLALALHELCHRNTRPFGDDAGDLLLGHGVVHEGVVALAALGCGLGFFLAMVLFSGVRSRVAEAEPPKSFEGLPITLVSAFFGLTGIIDRLFG